MNRSGLTRGFNRSGFVDLPSSADEVRIAQAAFPQEESKLLLGTSATEAAFKAAGLDGIPRYSSRCSRVCRFHISRSSGFGAVERSARPAKTDFCRRRKLSSSGSMPIW